MKLETKQQIGQSVQSFRLPRYSEIPNVGLYLEQAAKYMGEYLAPLGEYALTPSMISNYVKKGLIGSPVKKQYSRDQIAYLFFIAVAPLSRSSLASWLPVDAPEGTDALPTAPHSSSTSASTVGFPRESRISLPLTFTIS